ncbi:MAG: OB-fold domain-containing protein [Betaproteobacteria bacterium]|nr:OB-fold domain-containing protein [Betaproteobacteria bacterium]
MTTPILEGWFSETGGQAHLIGSRCRKCGTYYFPKMSNFCRNPDCGGAEFEDAPLSRTGRLWSYTNASYQPPAPYVAADPFVPFAIAAVELERERMVVLGQVISGVGVEALKVGMPMELVIETLAVDASGEKTVWKWKPAAEQRS